MEDSNNFEERFWVRWANCILSQRGLVLQNISDSNVTSVLLHLIEILDLSVPFHISNHHLSPSTKEEIESNHQLVRTYLVSKNINTEQDNQSLDFSWQHLKYIARSAIRFQGILLCQLDRMEAKLLQYIQSDVNDSSIPNLKACILDCTIFNSLLRRMGETAIPLEKPLTNEILREIEKKHNISHLLDTEELKSIDLLSREAIIIYIMNFYQDNSPLMKNRGNQDLPHRMIRAKGNHILKQIFTISALLRDRFNDCDSFGREIQCKEKELEESVSVLLSALDTMKETTSFSPILQYIMELMNQVCGELQQAETSRSEFERTIFTMREQMEVMNSRFLRSLQQMKDENCFLQEKIDIMETQLISEQEKNQKLILLVRDMAQTLEQIQSEKYAKSVQRSILDTLLEQQDVILRQQNCCDNEDIRPVDMDIMLREVETLTYDSDEDVNNDQAKLQSLLTWQHFGYLHEVINAQKEKIMKLEAQTKKTGDITCKGTQLKAQVDKERSSLSDYVQQLQRQIEEEKKTLQKIKRKQ